MPPRRETKIVYPPIKLSGKSSMSRRAFAAAKEPGNFTAIAEVLGSLTKTNYTLEVVDIAFFHLQPQWMEERTPDQYPDSETRLKQASELARAASTCASCGMTTLMASCPQNLRPQLIQKILNHLDDFSLWIAFLSPVRICSRPTYLIQYNNPSDQCTTLLYMLDFEDQAMSPRLHTSNEIVDFSISAWVTPDPLTNELCVNLDPEARCPILHLFSRFLFANDGPRERIFDVLFGAALKPKQLRAAVIHSATTRCIWIASLTRNQLETLPKRRMSGLSLALKYLELIFGIMHQLCLNNDMRNAVLKSTFFEEYVKALRVWLLEKSDRKDKQDRYQGLRMMDMVRSLVEPPDAPYKGWSKSSATGTLRAIRGGFVSILFEGMRSIPQRDNEYEEACWNSLKWIHRTCNQYPSLLEPVRAELVKLLGESFWQTRAFAHTDWDRHVRDFVLDVVAGGMIPKDSRFSFCDNLTCDSDKASRSSQVCSGCETMSYCSQKCQEIDWKAVHHGECKHASLFFHRLKAPDQLHYRPSLRQHHAQLSAYRAVLELEQTPSLRKKLDSQPSVLILRGLPFTNSVVEYGRIRGIAATVSEGVDTFAEPDGAGRHFPSRGHYLKRRIRALARNYVSEGWQSGQRLVDETHYLGYRQVSVLVLLENLAEPKSNGNEGGATEGGARRQCRVLFCITEMIEDLGGETEVYSSDDDDDDDDDEWI